EMRLEIGLAVPVEAQPVHAVENRVDRLPGGADLVGILDAQQELAAVVAGEQPVEQSGTSAADMEEAGGRGREAGDDLTGFSGCAHARILQGWDHAGPGCQRP